MIAIKNWFLRKNRLWGFYKKEIEQVRETEKAILVKVKFEDGHLSESWIPKSVIIDEWEKDTSPLGYHDYLVDIYHKAYDDQQIENYTIKSGRNCYRGDNFVHQQSTKKLVKDLQSYGIDFMSFDEWKSR